MPSTQRICVVVPKHWSTTKGGAEYQAEQIALRLAATNDTEVFFLAKEFDASFNTKNYRCIEVGSRLPTRLARGTLLDVVPLWGALEKIRPHAIYQRVGCSYTGVCGAYARRAGCRFIWHVAHDFDVTPGRFAGHGNRVQVFLEKRILERGLRLANAIITQTRQQAELLKQHYQRSDAIIVPNAHPVPEVVDTASRLIQVVWVSNFKPIKRPEIFIRLARALQGYPAARFLMIGRPSWDPKWQNRLEAEIESIPNLHYMGELSQAHVNEILSRSSLLVSSSEAEGFPNTFIQAWMRGVPVVSLGVDPDGILAKGTVGYAVKDENDLASVVAQLLGEPELIRKLGRNARDYGLAHHGPDNLYQIIRIVRGDISDG